MVTEARDIKTDPDCRRVMDPEMALGCSSSQDIIMPLVATQATQINMAPEAA